MKSKIRSSFSDENVIFKIDMCCKYKIRITLEDSVQGHLGGVVS